MKPETNLSIDESAGKLRICHRDDLIAGSGVCALVDGKKLALFYLPDEEPCLFAIDNWDPIGEAGVLARGIVSDIGGELAVASPLYKQHFSLVDGHCIEDPAISVKHYKVCVIDDEVYLLQR